MENERAELSALATSLDDLAARITGAADRYRGTPRSDLADGLYEVERSLLSASRKLEQILRTMR